MDRFNASGKLATVQPVMNGPQLVSRLPWRTASQPLDPAFSRGSSPVLINIL